MTSLAHDATSSKAKNLRDACISATDALFINRNGTRTLQPHELREKCFLPLKLALESRSSKLSLHAVNGLQVNIRVSVVDGVVHVNNTKAIHKAVTTFHFYAEIDEIGKNREVLQHMTKVPIVIRVLVNESEQINEQEVFKVLQVQEEIVEVDNKAVKQIKVTQLVLKLDSANNELIGKRVITKIELKDSAVHKMPQEKDNHKYPDGHLPDNPYSDPSNPKPKPAQLPDHPLEADTSKDGLCSKFHKLPFAARLAIFAVVALIGIGTFTCCLWVFCCKPPASGKKIDLKDFEDKFAYDGEFEAPALEQKVPIEKQKLVIDA